MLIVIIATISRQVTLKINYKLLNNIHPLYLYRVAPHPLPPPQKKKMKKKKTDIGIFLCFFSESFAWFYNASNILNFIIILYCDNKFTEIKTKTKQSGAKRKNPSAVQEIWNHRANLCGKKKKILSAKVDFKLFYQITLNLSLKVIKVMITI